MGSQQIVGAARSDQPGEPVSRFPVPEEAQSVGYLMASQFHPALPGKGEQMVSGEEQGGGGLLGSGRRTEHVKEGRGGVVMGQGLLDGGEPARSLVGEGGEPAPEGAGRWSPLRGTVLGEMGVRSLLFMACEQDLPDDGE